MKRYLATAIGLSLVALTIPALSDDASDCSSGISMIKAEIGKKPQEPVLGKLEKALRDAEREQKEKEYDECLEAVEDAKEAMK
jgi:hypothetical protein